MKNFNKEILANQFENPEWMNGLLMDELTAEFEKIESQTDVPHGIKKAQVFEMLLTKAAVAIDKEDIFQDKLLHERIMNKHNSPHIREYINTHFPDETEERNRATAAGEYEAGFDFGHTSPNSMLLLEIGFTGLLERIRTYSKKSGLSAKQKEFYKAAEITLSAIPVFIKRLAKAIAPYNSEAEQCLVNISEKAPQNSYEAMQTIIIYFFLHEYVYRTRVRTLGRLDLLLYPFFKKDIENGTYTKAEIKEMLKFFLNKFWTARVDYDLPFCIGGTDKDGNDAVNEMSYLIVEAYDEIDIHSPKIHVRVSDKTPANFVKLVLHAIRGGNSSFVFVNDTVGVKALENVGIETEDARNYVPIGCYEPAVWGVEIGCTGNGLINLVKAAEYAMNDNINSFDEFKASVKANIKKFVDKATSYVVMLEKCYPEFYTDSILSSMYDACVEAGADCFEGSAKYNNSSLTIMGIGTLTDIVCAVSRLVFDEQKLSFKELSQVLANNWSGQEPLRQYALSIPEKYGNGNAFANAISKEFSDYVAEIVTNRPNGRGGVFKAGLFSIDKIYPHGERTGATADGRLSGKPLSKNLCSTISMDKNGLTSLINSVTAMDHSKFPNGSVLDIILHPSAVTGEDGLTAMYGILLTYFKRGGFALHGNVFDANELKKAQANPEKYANLQVRVCGWNVFFVNLSKKEQDAFIKQAEGC